MDQKMKRFLSMLFCVILLFSGSDTAFAAGDVSGGDSQEEAGMAGVSEGDVSWGNSAIILPTASQSDSVFRVGLDRDTKGHWEGKYGSYAAVLYGYGYTGEKDPSGARFAVKGMTYDMTVKPENSPLRAHKYVIATNLWCFTASQTDETVLDMPSDVGMEKFNAYTSSGQAGQGGLPADVKRAVFEFDMEDQNYHQFSFYSNQTTKNPIAITILDKQTKTVLLTDILETTAFQGGAYLSYLIPGSFIMYIDKKGSSDYAFGFTGSFVDPVNENLTSKLAAAPGSKSRSAKLVWEEAPDIPDGTRIIIERKIEDDGVWNQLAAIDLGVKEYQDEDLQAGKTYRYRLKTQTGTLHSLAGSEAEYKVPRYKTTALEFDQKEYTAASTRDQVTVKVVLKDEEGAGCAGQVIGLQADFGHNVQKLESVTTDSNGLASFVFCPEYMGNAKLYASFADSDKAALMNSSAESALFVGEREWTFVPVIWRVSDAVLPDDLIALNGYGLKAENMDSVVIKYALHISDEVPANPPADAGTLEKVQTDSRDGYFLVTRLPADAQPGLYDIWVANDYGYSKAVTVNAARPLFISEYEVWNGQSIEISGRNFLAGQFGAEAGTMVRLNNGINQYDQFIAKVTPYSITFTVEETPVGEYQVEVSNDSGVSWRTVQSAQTLTVVEEGKDPLGLGYAWMDHFSWDNRFDVTKYGADGSDMADDTEAVQAAVAAAKASPDQGGVVYFPNGNYYIGGLKIPSDIILLGEDMEQTVLLYNGTGANMFEGNEEDRTIGHQGFAEFSVRLSDDNIRPDTFFWLGHPWDASANDVTYRTASEFFMKRIHLAYSQTKEDNVNRGLAVVGIGDERFTVQDCVFTGYAAGLKSVKFNRYSGYYRNVLDFEDGYLGTTASYSFVEECEVTGGLRKSGLADNHGIFGHQLVHMENNRVKEVGSIKNDGESYCVEAPSGKINYGNIINATSNTVIMIPQMGDLKEHYAVNHGRLAVRITDGRGMGQQRDIVSIDTKTNTITVKGEWDIIPDSTSKMTMIIPLDEVTIYNNIQQDCAKGIYLYGNIYDAVAANNTGIDTDGIYVHSSHVKNDREIPSAFACIRENVLSGVSPRTNDVKIAVQSTRRINEGNYYSVGIYGVEIRDNRLTGVRGSISNGNNSEAPEGSGLISWAAVQSGSQNSNNTDGYCGDNTNVIMENNILKSVDSGITTTLGDYGFVLKGNCYEDVGQELVNTNPSGTGNLLLMDSSDAVNILKRFVSVWEKVPAEDYTGETYERLQTAVAGAKAVLGHTDGAEKDDVAAALQELRIASGSLKPVVRREDNDGGSSKPDTALRVGIDKDTKGHWEGKYGSETAVLYGYDYTGEKDPSGARFAFAAKKYDMTLKSEANSMTAHDYQIAGKIWGFAADQADESVLDMPAGVDREKFNAYTASGKSGVEGVPFEYKRSVFEFDMGDTGYHQYSIYGNQSLKNPLYITVIDKTTEAVLLEETLDNTTFEGGAYVSYLIPGSFIMYIDKSNVDYGFGTAGSFFDPVEENKTTGLTVLAGTKPRSAKLIWTEKEDMPETTRIIVERKAKDTEEWEVLDHINMGVKEYQDEGLPAGQTYTYRLRTQNVTSYTLPGNEVEYMVPRYKNTILVFDKPQYRAVSTADQITVSITLTDEDGEKLSGQKISLQADYGHSVQVFDSEVTKDDGTADFIFYPNYLGEAKLTASYADNDEEAFMNASAENTLYVGEQGWNEAPVLWRVSDGVLPDDLIALNGYGLKDEDMNQVIIKYALHTADIAPDTPPADAGILAKVQSDPRDGYYLVTRLPADAQPGLYDIWVSNGKGFGKPITLNEPRPLFINEYEAWEGQNIEISGRNFAAGQFGAEMETRVRLNDGKNCYEQFLAKHTPYSIAFTVQDTPLGEYEVEVSNDNGVSWRGLASGQTLTVVEKGLDPLKIGYAWMDHFAWNNSFDVTEYGADGSDAGDDTEAIHAAIAAAENSAEKGGVIYFPKGNYYTTGIKIPPNIVLLGEDMEKTVLTYCGAAGDNMIESSGNRLEGRQGIAELSIRLSDDAVRPGVFFWFGQPWSDANDASLRKASEFFLYKIDLKFSMESDTKNGNGVVVVGDERFLVKDSSFSGNSAMMTSIKFNKYTGYYNVRMEFERGRLQSCATYHFVEDCVVTGGLRGKGTEDNHGIFGRDHCHMENNYVEEIGSFNHNDGEAFCCEMPNGYYNYGAVVNAGENFVTFHPECGPLKHYTLVWGRLSVRITGGKGMGQQRDVASMDIDNNTIVLKEDWNVVPDSTSKITLICPLDNVTIYNNVMKDSRVGISFYGNAYDCVAANNTSIDTEGVYIHSAHGKNDREAPSAFVSVRENCITGVSPIFNDVKIAVRSNRKINDGNFYSVGIYGIEIRDNQLTGVRGAVSKPDVGSVQASGLVSHSGMRSSIANADGYCGDNTNLLMENNYLRSLDIAVTTTLGDYGLVLKGNRMEDIGEELNNSNTQGTGNLLCMDSEADVNILERYMNIWEKVPSENYTAESYERLQTAIAGAKAVLGRTDGAEKDDVAAALQELRIASGSLRPVVRKNNENGDDGTGGDGSGETGGDDGSGETGGDDGSGGTGGDDGSGGTGGDDGSGGTDGDDGTDGNTGNEGDIGSDTEEDYIPVDPSDSANSGTEPDTPVSGYASPATGDANNIGISLLILASSAVLSVILARNLKKKKHKR